MDTNEMRERIMELNEEIGVFLEKAGYPRCEAFADELGNRDSDEYLLRVEIADIIRHFGYINEAIKKWSHPSHE